MDNKIMTRQLSFGSLKNIDNNPDPDILSPKTKEMNPDNLPELLSPEVNLKGSPMLNRNESKKLYDTQALSLKP
jgi:hypothetical protein